MVSLYECTRTGPPPIRPRWKDRAVPRQWALYGTWQSGRGVLQWLMLTASHPSPCYCHPPLSLHPVTDVPPINQSDPPLLASLPANAVVGCSVSSFNPSAPLRHACLSFSLSIIAKILSSLRNDKFSSIVFIFFYLFIYFRFYEEVNASFRMKNVEFIYIAFLNRQRRRTKIR